MKRCREWTVYMLAEHPAPEPFVNPEPQTDGLKPLETKGSGFHDTSWNPEPVGTPREGATTSPLMRPTSSPEVVHDSTAILDATIA